MFGRIVKGIAGFYYISAEDSNIYECKAKGVFRNLGLKPLIGDYVSFDILDNEEMTGNITKVLERKNELIRPAVANVDQAMIIFAVKDPNTNFNLLDRFLILMMKQGINTIICFNKTDKVKNEELNTFKNTYQECGCQAVFISAEKREGMEELQKLLSGKTTVLAGPSGVGKSSIINLIQPEAFMETGCISEKIKRGKHTTRHSELIYVSKDTYLFDTPGFSSLHITDIDQNELKNYFAEFSEYEGHCSFRGCVHVNEPNCLVKSAVDNGKISEFRYKNYLQIYNELRTEKRYK